MPETKLSFEISKLEILNNEGNVDNALEPKLSNHLLKEMYEKMILSRVFDRKAFSLQRQGRSYTFTGAEGQEASQIASVLALDPKTDWIFPSYRESPAMIAYGMPLERLFMYWMGS